MHCMFILSLHMFNAQWWTIGKKILWQYMDAILWILLYALDFMMAIGGYMHFFPILHCHVIMVQ